MGRQPHNPEQIKTLLPEVQARLSQGQTLGQVCKSLDISQSSYRRWRIKYGEQAKENLAGVASGSTEQSAGVRPSSTKNLSFAKTVKASPRGEVPKLSDKELLDAANGASDPARNAWLAFLALLTYLLVTLGGVSHKDLLLNKAVKLPIVNVDVPLFDFFQYAPALLLLIYLSLLIQHDILMRKYRKFTEAIAPYEKETGKEHPARELVHSYAVSQILAGPKPDNPVRSGLTWLMVFVTFILLPFITLLYFQIKFVPYHEVWITYWHRITVLIALAIVAFVLHVFYPWSRKREITIGPREELWISCGALFGMMVSSFSWLIATVPNERVDRVIGFVSPTSAVQGQDQAKLLNPLVRFAYQRIPEADNPEDRGWLLPWLISFRLLVVEDTDLVPDESDKQDEVSEVLRGRNLQFARLGRSDLHRADLTNADLRGAEMMGTRLDKAKLQVTKLQGAFLYNAQLQGADLRFAQLQGANLRFAQLQGANLRDAQLQGADLLYAELQGAYLNNAQLQGADLSKAQLQDAYLGGAQLQGAYLSDAQLQGASFQLQVVELGSASFQSMEVAQLQGADLSKAQLQGADLRYAELQGASLMGAQLQGADLEGAQLQGADLEGAQLQGADLEGAEIWLARFPDALADQAPVPLGVADLHMSPPTADAKAELKKKLQANITDGKLLQRLLDRLNPILRDDPPKWDDENSWRLYVSQKKPSPPAEIVQFLADMACRDPTGRIANAMTFRAESYRPRGGQYDYAKPLAQALLQESCRGAKALTEEMRGRLENLVSAAE